MSVKGSDIETEMRLAQGFASAVTHECGGAVPWEALSHACATFVGSCLLQLTPAERAVALSEMVDRVFAMVNDDHDADLAYFQ